MTTWKADLDTALIIVDVQNDFCKGGALQVSNENNIIPVINSLRKHFDTVVITQDFHPAGHKSFASSHPGKNVMDTVEMPYGAQILWPDHCVQGTEGANFHDDLEILESDLIIQKGKNPEIDSYSAFFENDKQTPPRFDDGKTLSEALSERGIKKTVLVGLAGDFCVGNTALDAIKEGFEATVVKDATRSVCISVGHNETTETIMDYQIFAEGGKTVLAKDLPAALNF